MMAFITGLFLGWLVTFMWFAEKEIEQMEKDLDDDLNRCINRLNNTN